jgi:hypothetical protein
MVTQKGAPPLTWWSPLPAHVFGYRRLRDRKAELE